MSGVGLLGGAAVLAVGTYLLRLAGPVLRTRYPISRGVEDFLNRASVVLLVAVALTGAIIAGHDVAGWARPAGVAAGVVAALARVPLFGVVVIAAATTAGLRLIGVA